MMNCLCGWRRSTISPHQAEELLKLATGGRVDELDLVIMEAQIALLTKHKATQQLQIMVKPWRSSVM
jgi:hypothetical protein